MNWGHYAPEGGSTYLALCHAAASHAGWGFVTDEECHRFAADVDITSLDVIGRIGADLTAGLPPSGPLEHVG